MVTYEQESVRLPVYGLNGLPGNNGLGFLGQFCIPGHCKLNIFDFGGGQISDRFFYPLCKYHNRLIILLLSNFITYEVLLAAFH
jgi:hypothetical protein